MKEFLEKHTPLEWKQIFEAPEFVRKYHYDGKDLGSHYTKKSTIFKVWAPTASNVQVCLYKTGSEEETGSKTLGRATMKRGDRGVFESEIAGDLKGIYYTYLVYANGEVQETGDIYAKACGVNGKRSMVVDLLETNPDGWEEDQGFMANTETPVIYELHVKDFSNDPNSGIPDSYRGKYLAFTQTETFLKGKNYPTCLAYLKALGITHVHLLPVYDFGSVDEREQAKDSFNWGYDPVNYNIPEGSYSTDPYHGQVRILEFKKMVMALHKAGIAVVMDVVFNHTFDTESWFQYTVPYYYYRLDKKGDFANGSLCGNDTASEHSMYRKYMIDSVCYWAREYHIDGFRFDLMGLHDTETMNSIRKSLDQLPNGKNILVYGEPWSGDYSPMAKGFKPANKENVGELKNRIAVFCDQTRDAIKGSVFFADEPGFVNGDSSLESEIQSAVCAWCDHADETFLPRNAGQIISYVSAHDNYTLWDKMAYTMQKTPDFMKEDKELLKRCRMAAGIYFTCLGTPFLQAGEEGARTKNGIGDSYKSHSEINQLNWKRIAQHQELVEYYKGLIHLRKHFHALSDPSFTAYKRIHFLSAPESSQIGFCILGDGSKTDDWMRLFIFYNGRSSKSVIDLPEGRWEQISDGQKFMTGEQRKESVIVGDYTVTIFGERKEYKK